MTTRDEVSEAVHEMFGKLTDEGEIVTNYLCLANMMDADGKSRVMFLRDDSTASTELGLLDFMQTVIRQEVIDSTSDL